MIKWPLFDSKSKPMKHLFSFEAHCLPPHPSNTVILQKGSQHLCVESPGVHELNFHKSCISFGSSSLRIATSDPSV